MNQLWRWRCTSLKGQYPKAVLILIFLRLIVALGRNPSTFNCIKSGLQHFIVISFQHRNSPICLKSKNRFEKKKERVHVLASFVQRAYLVSRLHCSSRIDVSKKMFISLLLNRLLSQLLVYIQITLRKLTVD